MESEFQIIKDLIEMDPFLKYVGIKVVSLDKGYAKLSMEFRQEITRLGNIVNGGAIATLADAAGGSSVLTLLTGKNHVTVSLNIEYLEPINNGPITAVSKIERKGKHFIFTSIDVFDGKNRLCAHAQGIYFLLDI